MLQGDIIATLYGNNLEDDPVVSAIEILNLMVDFEQRFLAWKRNLPSRLRKKPWLDKDLYDPGNVHKTLNFDRLSVILALRYRNARLLLRRPLLMLCLRGGQHLTPDGAFSNEEEPYFTRILMYEILVCEQDATDVIEIISSTNPHPSLRTTWWFSSYYCKRATSSIASHF